MYICGYLKALTNTNASEEESPPPPEVDDSKKNKKLSSSKKLKGINSNPSFLSQSSSLHFHAIRTSSCSQTYVHFSS